MKTIARFEIPAARAVVLVKQSEPNEFLVMIKDGLMPSGQEVEKFNDVKHALDYAYNDVFSYLAEGEIEGYDR